MCSLFCCASSSPSVSLTEIDAARKIADRALKAISFRHPQEKLNVWLALLNLENMYGSQRSMQETFQRATQFNDPLTVYMEVAKIYAATKKTEVRSHTQHSSTHLSPPFSFTTGLSDGHFSMIFPTLLYRRCRGANGCR